MEDWDSVIDTNLKGTFLTCKEFVNKERIQEILINNNNNMYQSTDTGDYLPEGYNPEEEIAFTSGMMGSQAMLGGDRGGPELPGMENLGADAVIQGGIEQSSEIPAGMEFTPSSVPDGEFGFNVGSIDGTFKIRKILLLSLGCYRLHVKPFLILLPFLH